MEDADVPRPIYDHVSELRKRLLVCLASVAVLSGLCYLFYDHILGMLVRPLGSKLIFTSPSEAFVLSFKISLLFGAILSTPIIFFEAWKFFSVVLNVGVKKRVLGYLAASALLSAGAVLFCYLVVIPAALRFLLGFGWPFMEPLISASQYFSFVITLFLSFVLAFQMPLVIIFLVRSGLVSIKTFTSKRVYVILIIFVAAAVITPSGDAFTQICLSVPLVLLFEMSILFLKLTS